MNNKIMDFYIDKVSRGPYFQMESNHFHSEYELYFLLSGTRKFFINHSFYTLHEHDLVLISKGELHRTSFLSDSCHERIVLYFNEQWLSSLHLPITEDIRSACLCTQKRTIGEDSNDYFQQLLNRMLQEYSSQDNFSSSLLLNYFEELLVFLMRTKESSHMQNEDTTTDSDIVSAAQYICNNYSSDLTLEDVAAYVNLSPTYFSKKFKTSTGFGFKEYLIHTRLKEAAHLLADTNDSITSIATRCGFSDSNYFGDLFRKVTNQSPRDYRKNTSYNYQL
ncbi:helix-turn-helix domain-containing protein [Anaerosporobacter faecicola]|uniref:helix-turn-helix domain-containing protein n=1 Tax=Anaerosporobacter faecicola TaxID=2718714 RepID=UPI00143CA71C|nr:AraC family transcriptional regulator [Anaerosporobacter faecicola]